MTLLPDHPLHANNRLMVAAPVGGRITYLQFTIVQFLGKYSKLIKNQRMAKTLNFCNTFLFSGLNQWFRAKTI